MNNTEIKHKLRVFISSKCGGKYTIARKALQKLLDSTGLVETYVFETEPASSEDTKSAYLEYIDGSNLCVFLIDNKDGVPAAVLSEEKRAKDMKLRLLYIFCDENEKNETPMQQGIKDSLKQKYRVVHEFADIVAMAYDSILQDLIAVYKRKETGFVNDECNDLDSDKKQISTASLLIPFNGRLGFPYVSRVFTESIFPKDPTRDEPKETDLEYYLSEQLKIVLYEKKYDDSLFEKICDEALKKHEKETHKLITIRFEAQKAYYYSNYTECFDLLKKAIQIAIDNNNNIPIWLANDIAIDLRYIQGIIDEGNSQITIENLGQKYIDESKEPIYYPLLDRQIKDMQEKIADRYYKQLNISPYATTYGGIELIFNHLANAFVIAELHGSILQTELTRNRLISIYSMLCTLYGDHDLVVEYVRLLIINRNKKQLDELLRTYNTSMSILDDHDIKGIIESVNCISDHIHQTMSKYLLMSRLGDYFDDKSYKESYDNLLQFAMNWSKNDNRVYNMNSYIFEFFRENNYRNKNDDVVEFIGSVIDNQLSNHYIECFKLIRTVDFSKVRPELQEKIKNIFIYLLSEDNGDCNNQFFYNDTFLLELSSERGEDPITFINTQLDEAQRRNKSQGKNGCYSLYLYEPIDTIKNIIVLDIVKPDKKLLNKIVDVIIETLNMENQTIDSKKSAFSLLQLLYLNNKELDIWKSVYEKLKENISIITAGKSARSGSNENNSILSFQYNLFICDFDKTCQNKVIEKLYSLSDDSYNIIQFLKVVEMYLELVASNTHNEELISSFLYYNIMMSQHKERDVKFYATKCLIELTKFDYTKKLALIHLSQIMDTGSEIIKVAILKRISKIQTNDDSYIVQIINQGKADNNCFVRYTAMGVSDCSK